MRDRLLQFIHSMTERFMRFLMDNDYPIKYDSELVCQEGTIFDQCYCPIHDTEDTYAKK